MPSSRVSDLSVDTPPPVPPAPDFAAAPEMEVTWQQHSEEGTGGVFLVDTTNAPSLRDVKWLAEIAVRIHARDRPPEAERKILRTS